MSDIGNEFEVKAVVETPMGMREGEFADGDAALSTSLKGPKDCKRQRGFLPTKFHVVTEAKKLRDGAETLMGMRRDAFAVGAAALSTGPRWPKGCKKERRNASSSSSSHPRRDREEPTPPPQLSEVQIRHIIDDIDGSNNKKLLTEKVLSNTDVAGRQNRLSLACREVDRLGFLREDEKQSLIKPPDVQGYPAIRVRLIEPSGEQSWMRLKSWKIGSVQYYVLTKQWGSVVRKHNIVAGDTLRVLSFRYGDDELGIALVRNPTGVTK